NSRASAAPPSRASSSRTKGSSPFIRRMTGDLSRRLSFAAHADRRAVLDIGDVTAQRPLPDADGLAGARRAPGPRPIGLDPVLAVRQQEGQPAVAAALDLADGRLDRLYRFGV